MTNVVSPRGLKMLPKILFTALMLFISIVCLMQNQIIIEGMTRLGYPVYMITLLGIGYGLGAMGIWQGVYPVMREWAYAGYTFAFLGSLASHFMYGNPPVYYINSTILLVLCLAAYRLDSQNRK